ncbi:MAG: hypothetical protein GSR85_02350 [Desulfurococcales archaeon]|nr:hypothetical protein [Desulfurococcales archaeon]
MGLFDEVVLDERTKSLLREYAGDGVFQTKYWMTEEGYIRAYNFVVARKRVCCPISLSIDLLVKPRTEFVCEEPLMRRLKLEEIGIAEMIQATASTIVYPSYYNDLAKLLTNEGFQLKETMERYDYRRVRRKFATIPLKQTTSLKLKKTRLNDLIEENAHESEHEDDLFNLFKKHRIVIYIDNGEYGIAVPPGAIIEVHLHSLDVYIEDMQKHPYKEEEWVKNIQEETKLELKVIIRRQPPTEARIEATIVSELDGKAKERIDQAIEAVSSLLSKILM